MANAPPPLPTHPQVMESNKLKVFQYHPKILNLARKGANGAERYKTAP